MTTKTATPSASTPQATAKTKAKGQIKGQTSSKAKTKPVIFIDGEAGTTGLEIRRRVAGLAGLEVKSIAPDKRKDADARRAMMREVDLVVLCLPDDAAKQAVALIDELGEDAPKVVDASTAHRVAPGWVYGFPEMDAGQAEAVRNARRVSNPGCYPTAAIALIRPLVEAGLLPADYPVTVNAVSGYSGGGRSMIEAYEAGTAPAFELYGLGFEHKHLPEMQNYAKLDAPADLRALGRQLPPGHAGERAPAPRHAAGQAGRGRPRGGAGQALRGREPREGGAGRRWRRQGQAAGA